AGARQPLVDTRPVEQFQPGRARDRVRRRLRDDTELRLSPGKCGLDVEPGLPTIFQTVERADPWIRHASGSRKFIAHEVFSARLGTFFLIGAPRRRYTAASCMASGNRTVRWAAPRRTALFASRAIRQPKARGS